MEYWKEKLRPMLPFLVVILLDFYLLPTFIVDTGSAMFILLMLVPIICFICSMLYGILKPFSIWYSVLVGIVFLPSISLFYNSSAAVYSIIYGITALLGSGLGLLINKGTTIINCH